MIIKCCKDCTDKRRPGCHDHCEEYQQERAKYLEQKNKYDKERGIKNELYQQRDSAVVRAKKRQRRPH
jgi:hypothetical protein